MDMSEIPDAFCTLMLKQHDVHFKMRITVPLEDYTAGENVVRYSELYYKDMPDQNPEVVVTVSE